MIPKIIHYCWLSNDPLPDKIQECVESWKKNLPDYQIKRWDFSIFPKGKSKWVDDAFDAKKYAFAADYIRCYALFHEGGVYLDSDVEVLKSFDSLLHLPYFLGEENEGIWEAAVMGSEPGNVLFGEMLRYYDNRSFITKHGLDTIPLPQILCAIGNSTYPAVKYIKSVGEFDWNSDCLQILPFDYFSPKSYKTGKITLTDRTYSIHHFTASWHGKKEKLYETVSKYLGRGTAKVCSKIYKQLRGC